MFDIRSDDDQLPIESNRRYSRIRITNWSPSVLKMHSNLTIYSRRGVIERKYRHPLLDQLLNLF